MKAVERIHVIVLRVTLGIAMLFSGASKIAFASSFAINIRVIPFPKWLHFIILVGVPLIEIIIGALLVSRYKITIAANIAIALIVVFTAYIMLHYGAAGNCGCYGDILSVGFDKYAVYKNAILLMGFIYLNYRESHRNVPRNKTAEAL